MGCSPSLLLDCMKNRRKLEHRKIRHGLGKKDSLVSFEISESRAEFRGDHMIAWQVEEVERKGFRQVEFIEAFKGNGRDDDHSMDPEMWNEKSTITQMMSNLEEDLDLPAAKSPQDLKPNLLTTSAPNLVKILLVFGREDQQSEVLEAAATRLGWSVSTATNAEKAVELFQNRCHEIVIIDRRGQRSGSDADDICRAIRNTNCHHSSVIIALVRKSFFMATEKDEIGTSELLTTGFSRALVECSHEGILINHLVGIYASEIQPRCQLAAIHALYIAVDRCRDMIHVTDDRHILQFANKASEKLLGFKAEELMGKNLSEVVTSENFALMDQQLQRGREFEGNVNCKRKMNDFITVNCRIIPFCASGRKPTHYIHIHDTTYLLENVGILPSINSGIQQHPRGSLHSLRRGSFDVRSIGSDTAPRRSSISKLNNLPLEAPITRVITLLTNALSETTNPEIAAQIDKAIETLASSELYVPSLKQDTKIYKDPVASDLIGALLSTPYYAHDSRRSSNDSSGRLSAVRSIFGNNPNTGRISKTMRLPHEILELLDHSLDWDFDIFKLEVLSGKRTLVFLGMTIMNLYDVPARLGCDEKTMQNWLTLIEVNYNPSNSYHNSTHAADVLQAIAKFMQSEKLKQILDPLDEVAALIAAAAHDIDHPGRSSQFLCNADNKLAILYNDLSVLESHHAALTFKLTLTDDSVNIFKNLERETYKLMRHNVIDMILATEMTKHFEHLAKFVNVCSSRVGDAQSEACLDADMSVLLLPENVTLVKRIMIKCADVSNPTRPLKCCIEWARRIAEEYFSQTDEEKRLKMPVVMPMFDRLTCSIPKAQIGFVDYIINDMIEAWDVFIDMPDMLGHMRRNYEKWKEYHEQGISTVQDIEKLQQLSELQIPRIQ